MTFCEISESSFYVDGISCSSCVSAIENKLSSCEGVMMSSVDLTSGKVYMKHNDSIFSKNDAFLQLESIGFVPRAHKKMQESSNVKLLKFCLFFSIAEFFVSMILPMFSSILEFDVWGNCKFRELVELFLVFPVQIVAGRKFFRKSRDLLNEGVYSMEILLLMGTSVAFMFSVLSTLCAMLFRIQSSVMYETSSTLITFILIGKIIEDKSKRAAELSSDRLAEMRPTSLIKVSISTDSETTISILNLKQGDYIRVHAGEIIPTDGVVMKGYSRVDERSITGEPMFKQKGINDFVCAGSTNLEFPLLIQSTVSGNHSLIDKVIKTVEKSHLEKSKNQIISDKIASFFIPGILALSLCTFVSWLLFLTVYGTAHFHLDPQTPVLFYALRFAVSVILFSCPCSISLAIPMAFSVGINYAASLGILVKNGSVFEKCNSIKHVVFDKTGTLTCGSLTIIKHQFYDTAECPLSTILTFIYELECLSSHQISTIIRVFIKKSFPTSIEESVDVESFKNTPARGLSASLTHGTSKKKLCLGSFDWVCNENSFIENENYKKCKDLLEFYADQGLQVIAASLDGLLVGYFIISDSIKPDAFEVVASLRKSKKHIAVASGDTLKCTKLIANQLEIDDIYGKMSPVSKHILLKSLKCLASVMMVGDGINDSAALAVADVGVAVCDSNGVAFQSADVVLMKNNLQLLLDLFEISSAVSRTITFNFVLSFLYNFLGLPFTTGIFFKRFRIYIHPMISGILMSTSSLIVVVASLSIKWQLVFKKSQAASKTKKYSRISSTFV